MYELGDRGWVGAGYLVARRLDPDGVHAHRVARFGYPEGGVRTSARP